MQDIRFQYPSLIFIDSNLNLYTISNVLEYQKYLPLFHRLKLMTDILGCRLLL